MTCNIPAARWNRLAEPSKTEIENSATTAFGFRFEAQAGRESSDSSTQG